MVRHHVLLAPQEREGWDGQHEQSIRPQRGSHTPQRAGIILEVLEDVERRNPVEISVGGDVIGYRPELYIDVVAVLRAAELDGIGVHLEATHGPEPGEHAEHCPVPQPSSRILRGCAPASDRLVRFAVTHESDGEGRSC
ncbi:MAG: hypothetical protein H0U29_03210 [Acidimicrobiia bacterium]|nr:hypothetical protein [Acidimicrobiia bacterium]